MQKIEYRVIPVTRYFVTRFEENGRAGGCDTKGEYENEAVAYEVGYALCKAEHDALGWLPGDERISYPLNDAARKAEQEAKAASA